jgi:hypothetical protein
LEESSELLLKDPSSLNLLEQLQVNKTTEALQQISQPSLFNKKIKSIIDRDWYLRLVFAFYYPCFSIISIGRK